MAKTIRPTTPQTLSRFRNLTKGRLINQKETINNILLNLPPDCKSLSDDEKEILLRLRSCYNDILSTWDHRSKKLMDTIKNSI